MSVMLPRMKYAVSIAYFAFLLANEHFYCNMTYGQYAEQ